MQVPNADDAHVPPAKLYRYLLSQEHPEGGPKARLLRSVGFDESNADQLEEQLLAIVRSVPADGPIPTPFGMKYVVHGTLRTPVGRQIVLRTVWIVPPNDPRPRFVTAYPLRD
jgi:hypothetical protein